jgi:signal transduction histidine kinase
MRFRLALMYSLLVFVSALLLTAGVYLAVSRSVSGEPVSETYQVTRILHGPDFVTVEESTVRAELQTLEEVVNQRTLDNLARWSLITVGLLLPSSFLIGWFVSGRALRPIGEISGVAREIQASDLSRRIELDGPDDEIKQLADTFDEMLDRVEQGVEDQRAFIQDASHELRNPLATMAANLDVALTDPDADVASLRHTAEVVRRTVARTARTVDAMVIFARREVPESRATEIDLMSLIAESAEEFEAPASARDMTIVTAGSSPTAITGDRTALKIAFSNLLDNAVKFATEGSTVTAAVGAGSGWTWMGARDEGPGIPTDNHDRVFRRFWRQNDVPRSSGLGLAIVRQVAESHGGTVTLSSDPDGPTSFVIWLPTGETPDPATITTDGIHPVTDPML